MLKPLRRAPGFTIIEVLTVMAVIGIVLTFALPSFNEWLQTQQIRVASDAILNGLQVARSEAIRRNLSVEVAIGVPQTGWTVSESVSRTVVQTRTHEEGSNNAVVATLPGGSTTVTFTPLGGLTSNNDGSLPATQIDISNPNGGECQVVGNNVGMRCLRILVSAGGSTRMCDPAVLNTGTPPDPRSCP